MNNEKRQKALDAINARIKKENIETVTRCASIITRALSEGFAEVGQNDTLQEACSNAERYLIDNIEPQYEQCHLEHGVSQCYTYVDESGVNYNTSGDITDFGIRAKAKDERIFKDTDEDGKPIWCNWFDIESGEEYYFIYDTIVTSCGDVVKLYDSTTM